MKGTASASATPPGGTELDNRRLVAGLIDLLVVLAGAISIGLAAGLSGEELAAPGMTLGGVVTAWALYYYFACESGGGQTLGKKLMRIRVASVDGGPAGMGEIAVRTVLRLIDGLFLYLVGLIAMLATGERRARLGDLAARTMIVSADAPQRPVVATPAPVTATITLPSRSPEATAPEHPTETHEMRPFEPFTEPEPVEDEEQQVVLNSVEPVPAIDLVMDEAEIEPSRGGPA